MPLPLVLSKILKLKDVDFLSARPSVKWITTTFQTAKAKTLWQITVRVITNFVVPIQEMIRQEWHDLDHLLVELWT